MDFLRNITDHLSVIERLKLMAPEVQAIAEQLAERIIDQGSTVYWMGNGGSAADAQHLAAELVGRFQLERPAIASFALHTDSSVMTSLSNDYDYEVVFARQLQAMCRPQDIVIGISTSGNSRNVLQGLAMARERGALTIGLTGQSGGQMPPHCDHCIQVPSTDTARIQEAHILIGHSMCEHIEQRVAAAAAVTV